jgi:hypothetical protein
MGAVFSMLGFIISLAVGVLLFGLSAAFSMILLGIAAVSADHLIIKTGVLMLRHSRFHFHNHM